MYRTSRSETSLPFWVRSAASDARKLSAEGASSGRWVRKISFCASLTSTIAFSAWARYCSTLSN